MKKYKQRRNINLSTIYIILSLLTTMLLTPEPLTVEASGATIYVPDDHPTIQDAINNATSGDTIIVRDDNTYRESINIDKQLTIQGENKEATVIDAMGDSTAVDILSDDVYLSGFTVYNASNYGVQSYSSNVTIENCIIHNCSANGIFMWISHNTTIKDTEIYYTSTGIYSLNSHNVLVSDCVIHHNNKGFYVETSLNFTINSSDIYNQTGNGGINLFSSDHATIQNCDVYNNSGWEGIDLDQSDHTLIVSTNVHENEGDGIYVQYSDRNTISNCTIYKNEWFGLSLHGSHFALIESCQFYNHSSDGIRLSGSDHCCIKNCECHHNHDGIELYGSDITSICNSTIYSNDDDGVVSQYSLKTYLAYSKLWNNTDDGLKLEESKAVALNSNFSDNWQGVETYKSVFDARYCSFENNTNYGINSGSYSIVNASNCWWGNMTGPYQSSKNPTGTGDWVSFWVEFMPWQTVLTQYPCYLSDIRYHSFHNNWHMIYPSDDPGKPLVLGPAMLSDWTASGLLYSKLASVTEGVDTDPLYVDQSTGRPFGETGEAVATFGGPDVNMVTYWAENGDAPVHFVMEGDRFYFKLSNGSYIPGADLPVSVINFDEDMFVIEVFEDPDGRFVVILQGFGWKGSYAAGKYFDRVMYPDLESYPFGWIIVKWDDINGDGYVNAPGDGDTYTVVATGN